MSDAPVIEESAPTPSPVVEEAPAPAPVIEEAPAPAPAPLTLKDVELAVSPAGFDLKNPAELLKYALKVIGAIKLMAHLTEEAKASLIISEVKKAISASSLSDTEKTIGLGWADAVLPHVVQAVDLITNELTKVQQQVVSSLKSCCPSFFA